MIKIIPLKDSPLAFLSCVLYVYIILNVYNTKLNTINRGLPMHVYVNMCAHKYFDRHSVPGLVNYVLIT